MPGVKRLSGALMVRMTPVMVAAIEAVATRAELPVSEVVRQCPSSAGYRD